MSSDGRVDNLHIARPLLRAWPTGIGCLHPERGHGTWRGDLGCGHERWRADDVETGKVRHQLVLGIAPVELGGGERVGIIEQTCLGPCTPYGFVGATGVAP